MSIALSNSLNDEQAKLFEDNEYLLTYLFLVDHDATVTQISNFTGISRIKTSYIINQLLKHGLVSKNNIIGERNVQRSTYSVLLQNVDMSNIVKDNKVGTTHLLLKKIQTDLVSVLSNSYNEDFQPRISYASYQLSEESHKMVINKTLELFELINELERKDKEANFIVNPVVLFLALYSNQ